MIPGVNMIRGKTNKTCNMRVLQAQTEELGVLGGRRGGSELPSGGLRRWNLQTKIFKL